MDQRDEAKPDDPRRSEEEDLERLRRDVGENYDSFGELLDDSPAAVIDQVFREHPEHGD